MIAENRAEDFDLLAALRAERDPPPALYRELRRRSRRGDVVPLDGPAQIAARVAVLREPAPRKVRR